MGSRCGEVVWQMIEDGRIEIADAFFSLPESAGYAVGGGMAAVAHRVVDRWTEDIDLFCDARRVLARPLEAARALATSADERGWTIGWVRRFPDYARLSISTPRVSLLVDIALEPADLPPVMTLLGPTLAEQDAAVGKLVALFDRAEARDFVDFFGFSQRLDPNGLLEIALIRDRGLQRDQFAERLRRVTEVLTPAQFPAEYRHRFEEIRDFYAEWRKLLI